MKYPYFIVYTILISIIINWPNLFKNTKKCPNLPNSLLNDV